ncbi:hypothetical protein HZC53_03480 [Candidatus Uhrbacteria bacterium]|nr:hypothetical protein [Candidatus Uhrbacteria bacterium]
MHFTKISLLAVLSVAFLLGAGCSGSKTQNGTATGVPSNVPSAQRGKPETKPLDPKSEYLLAQANFHNAKSFKAKFTLPTSQGIVKGDLSYLKPDRFRGTMQMDKGDITDMILVADNCYMRVGNNPWVDISGSKVAKQTIENMRTAVQGNKVLDQSEVENLEIVSKRWDQLRSCDMFAVRLKDSTPDLPVINLCVQDGYPLFLEVDTPNGVMHVDYYNYSSVFLIERPM